MSNMIYFKSFLWILGVAVHVNGFTQDVQALGSCRLVGIPASPDPQTLPPIPDNLQSDARAWAHAIEGDVVGISGRGPHLVYLIASFSLKAMEYRWTANARTQAFVKEQKTRTLKRDITLRCNDGSQSDYSFEMQLQDGEPPVFGANEYTFDITSDWNLERPISDGQLVTVSDTAIELENGEKNLTFVASKDILRVEPHPLWVLPGPARYYYRLDIYLNENAALKAGESIQINLSALDEFNSGTVTININVSDE